MTGQCQDCGEHTCCLRLRDGRRLCKGCTRLHDRLPVQSKSDDDRGRGLGQTKER